ncbi:MAG: type I glyceraldehyde-3-phosphate dehydrogenase [Patescibacteria group bacterium]
MNIAINGFGRIGRSAARIIIDRGGQLVAINDLADNQTLAHLFKYDSNYGTLSREVGYDQGHLLVDGKKIICLGEKDPEKLPWEKLKIDVVLECTGRFTDRESAAAHLRAGAKRVIISAPAKGDGIPTHIVAVNDDQVGDSPIINNASCTTNSVAGVAAILQQHFGIAKATMTTIHSYTQDQNLQDAPHADLRRSRAAAENIVPTTTGAAISTTEVIPELKGLFDGLAIRVPTPIVSLSDMTFLLKKPTSVEEVNQLFIEASTKAPYQGILAVSDKPLVSSDFKGHPASAIVDLGLTKVIDGDLVKVICWYDNEFGYANRLVELAEKLGG